MEFISNSWFISIIGGLFVTLTWEIIKLLMERKAYNRQIKLVQNDFSVIIKSIIGEEELPTPKILESLLKGIAQKHNVKFKDVSEVGYIFHALIGEVMESSFLEYNQKILFCEKIEELSECLSEQIKQTNGSPSTQATFSYSKQRLLTLIPVLGISSSAISAIINISSTNEKFKKWDDELTKFLLDNPLILIGLIIGITIFVFLPVYLLINNKIKKAAE
ncbi:hypothetical protein NY607_01695 [Lysinibacillus sp. A4]|uniref:hypothetical protein n=1 Tax=Lysinibacillus sp. A4 TaxID=2976269 RepID=UPI0021761B2A|nr:hypothetical protein [Lysinibacillus sp. A4]MCS5499816.1 hypothetical protein [Lysinibacillus sp. A4]